MSRLVLLVALASFLFAGGKPALETGAAGGVTLPRCAAEGYGLEQQRVPRAPRAGGAVRLTAGWVTAMEKRRSCRLQTTIRLTIKGPHGMVAGGDWSVKSVRPPWSSIVHTWVWRNWCEPGGATVEFSAPGERTTRQQVSAPPVCVSPGAPSTVAGVGTGTKYVPRPSDRFPPHILPTRAPPPLPAAVLKVTNAWLVSDGYTLVAVYAGSPGVDPSIGRFAIIRQNEIFGIQYAPPDIVDVPGAGALTITRAPHSPSRETTAQRGQLGFVSANGTKGVLELTGDHVRITARP